MNTSPLKIAHDMPAFPVNDHGEPTGSGISEWDYFAAAAVAGHCAIQGADALSIAAWSAEVADAMIAERRKRNIAAQSSAPSTTKEP